MFAKKAAMRVLWSTGVAMECYTENGHGTRGRHRGRKGGMPWLRRMETRMRVTGWWRSMRLGACR